MRKLRLDVDSIRVESFRTSEAGAWNGTVRGNVENEDWAIIAPPPDTLPPAYTCDTCRITCETRCTCATNVGCTTCT